MNAKLLAERALAALLEGPPLLPAALPTIDVLAALLEEVFWSSLDRYEDVPLRARIYVAPRAALQDPGANLFRLAAPIRADRGNIRRLAPAHGRYGALIVDAAAGEPAIDAIYWNAHPGRTARPNWLCIESTGTGVVRVTTIAQVLVEFTRGVVTGDRSVHAHAAALALSRTLEGEDARMAGAVEASYLFLSIASSIERNGTGGALWLLPAARPCETVLSQSEANRVLFGTKWAEPFREESEKRTSVIRMNRSHSELVEKLPELQWYAQAWDLGRQEAVCTAVGDLARVDGAILCSVAPEVYAFGVICNAFAHPVQRVLEPTNILQPLAEGTSVELARMGGSRHRSAMNFCSTHAPAAAIVASHDGGLTVFTAANHGEVRRMRLGARM